jgi:hypothetical protein
LGVEKNRQSLVNDQAAFANLMKKILHTPRTTHCYKKLIILPKAKLQLQHQRRKTSAALTNNNSTTHATTANSTFSTSSINGSNKRAIIKGDLLIIIKPWPQTAAASPTEKC